MRTQRLLVIAAGWLVAACATVATEPNLVPDRSKSDASDDLGERDALIDDKLFELFQWGLQPHTPEGPKRLAAAAREVLELLPDHVPAEHALQFAVLLPPQRTPTGPVPQSERARTVQRELDAARGHGRE